MRRCTLVGVVVGTLLLAALIAVILFFVLQSKSKSKNALTAESSEIRDTVLKSFNSIIRLISTTNVAIPDLYTGCGGSTINRLKFCGNVKYGGTIDVGGSALCSIPYNACRAGCTAACIPCHIIPFVSCDTPCKKCPEACKKVYDICSGGTNAEWSVNVLEVFDLGNTFRVEDLHSFTLDKNETSGYDLGMKLVVRTTPKAQVDIRTTAGLGNYKGNVGLGNLKITVPVELTYNCTTKQTTLKKLDEVQVEGVDVHFEFSSLNDVIKKQIYKLAKSKIDDTIKDKLQDKLTSFFKDFIQTELLSRLQLNLNC